MSFVFKTRNFVFKMMNFAGGGDMQAGIVDTCTAGIHRMPGVADTCKLPKAG